MLPQPQKCYTVQLVYRIIQVSLSRCTGKYVIIKAAEKCSLSFFEIQLPQDLSYAWADAQGSNMLFAFIQGNGQSLLFLHQSVQSLDQQGHQRPWGVIQLRSSSSFFVCVFFLQMAIKSSSSTDHPLRCPEGWFWRVWYSVTCPNHTSFHFLTVARRGSCGSTKELLLLHTQ